MTFGIIILCALVPLSFVLMLLKRHPERFEWFRKLPKWKKCICAFALAVLIVRAVDKPTPPAREPFFQEWLIDASNGKVIGQIKDVTGRILPWLRSLVQREVNARTEIHDTTIASLASQGLDDIEALKATIHSNDIDRVFLTLNVPYTPVAEYSAHFRATVLREDTVIEGGITYRDAYIYFNQPVASNLIVYADARASEFEIHTMEYVSHSYPATFTVNGFETYRFRYRKPNIDKPMVSDMNVTLGSKAGAPLSISDFVVVDEEGVHFTFSGVIDFSTANTELVFTYRNGLVVKAVYNGQIILGAPVVTMSAMAAEPLLIGGGDEETE